MKTWGDFMRWVHEVNAEQEENMKARLKILQDVKDYYEDYVEIHTITYEQPWSFMRPYACRHSSIGRAPVL